MVPIFVELTDQVFESNFKLGVIAIPHLCVLLGSETILCFHDPIFGLFCNADGDAHESFENIVRTMIKVFNCLFIFLEPWRSLVKWN